MSTESHTEVTQIPNTLHALYLEQRRLEDAVDEVLRGHDLAVERYRDAGELLEQARDLYWHLVRRLEHADQVLGEPRHHVDVEQLRPAR